MKLSVSNIAWDVSEDPAIADRLRQHGIDRLDIAPGKYFPSPESATLGEIEAVRRVWQDRGFTIEGMQALLFGTSGLNLFGDSQDAMLRRLTVICRIGGALGARALTFGSPRQRDRSGLSDEQAEAMAIDFFRRLGDAAAAAGVTICLEPNAAVYGCNFMVTTDEAAAMTRAVDHPAVKLQLDVGTLALNDEPIGSTIARHATLIGHVHASEPHLVALGTGGSRHAEAATALRARCPDRVVTIEMTTPPGGPAVADVEQALRLAQSLYGEQP